MIKFWNWNGFCYICSIATDIDLGSEADLDGQEVVLPELDQKDEKSFEMVQKIIEG